MAVPEAGLKAVILGMPAFSKNARTVSASFNQIDKQSSKLAKTSSKNFGKISKAGALAMGIVSTALLAGGAALIQFGQSAIKEGAAFTKAMSQVASVTGAVGKDFGALSKQAKELGATTKFTAIEAAEGMGFLGQAGFETIDILQAMPTTLDLASAANLDLGKTADIVSNILKGFGEEASRTGEFADILTTTFVSSNTNLSQLGNAMAQVAPIAKSLGLTVGRTATAIGVLSDAGIQGFKAGTGLRGVLTSLTKVTGKAKDKMDELGVSAFNMDGEFRSLPDIIGQFEDALAGMTVEQKQAALSSIFNQRQIATFQVLLEKGSVGLEEFGTKIEKGIGKTSEIAGVQLENLSGDLTLLNSALSGLKITVFEEFEGQIRETTQSLTELIKLIDKAALKWGVFLRKAEEIEAVLEDLTGESANLKNEFSQLGKISFLGPSPESMGKSLSALLIFINGVDEVEKSLDAASSSMIDFTKANSDLEPQNFDLNAFAEWAMTLEGANTSLHTLTGSLETLNKVEIDETQQLVELNRFRDAGRVITDDWAISQENLTKIIEENAKATELAQQAEEDRVNTLLGLTSLMGDFFLSQISAQDAALQSQMNFSQRSNEIANQSALSQEKIFTSLADKNAKIEEDRAKRIHFIMTGAHARTAELNALEINNANAHFDKLIADTTTKHERKKEIVLQKEREKQAGLAAARARELEAQKEHIEQLKLVAALAALETTGQLETFTSGLASSAQDAAALIQSGVLPVTQEMGVQLQTILGELATTSETALATAGENASLISQALAGTLIEEVGPAITSISDEKLVRMGQQFTDTTESSQLGLENVLEAIQNDQVELDKLSGIVLPTLNTASTTTTNSMIKGFDSAGEAGKKAADKTTSAWNSTLNKFKKVEEFVSGPLVDAFNDLRSAAESAAGAASGSISAGANTTGTAIPQFASGGDVQAGLPVKVGEGGTELFIPATDGRIVPNHQVAGFTSPTISSMAAPSLSGSNTSISIVNQFTTTIIDNIDEAMFTEKVQRAVVESVNA